MSAAVFIDRDGVINELAPDPLSGRPESPLEPDSVALLPGVAAALRRLRDAGYLLVGISNQPAAAKGVVPAEQLERVHARVLSLLEREGAPFDAYRLCLHHPEGVDPDLTRTCECRKPAPGMLLDAARALRIDLAASWMIGDTDGDVAAGAAAGCRTVLVENPRSAHKRTSATDPHGRAPDLAAAATLILDADSG